MIGTNCSKKTLLVKSRGLMKIAVINFLIFLSVFVNSSANAVCYLNSESHLPYTTERCAIGSGGVSVCSNSSSNHNLECRVRRYDERWCYTSFPSDDDIFGSCGPNPNNADVTWLPNQAVRRALFDTAEVQNTAGGCQSYGQLLKAECNPGFPVLTIFYDTAGTYKIESLVVERNPLLSNAADLSASIKNYIQARLKIPSGNWASSSFLKTVIVPKPGNGLPLDIIQYVTMMNFLYRKYPTYDYQKAYIDYINGDSIYIFYYLANYEFVKKIMNNAAITVINNLLMDE